MKAVVTGVAGFIGSRLAAALLSEGYGVVGVDSVDNYYSQEQKRANLARLRKERNFIFIEGDLLQLDLSPVLSDSPQVFHLAGQPGVRASWGTGFDSYLRNNVAATQRLLEACLIGNVGRFVYSSSSSVYGDALRHPTPESTLPQPRSPYGASKLAAEHLVSLYARNWDLNAVSLRYFTVYGAGQRPDMAIERMIRAARSGSAFAVFGDGRQSRDFTHVSDVVRANQLAGQAETCPGEVFNIAGGSQATLLDVIAAVQSATQRQINLRWEPAAAGDVQKTSALTDRARSMLGWSPTVQLADGIAEQTHG